MNKTTPTTNTATMNHHNSNNNNHSYQQCNAAVGMAPTATTTTPTTDRDEVDFVAVANNNNNNINDCSKSKSSNNCNHSNNKQTLEIVPKSTTNAHASAKASLHEQPNNKETTKCSKKKYINNNVNNSNHIGDDSAKKSTTKERLSLFSFGRRTSHKVANAPPKATASPAKTTTTTSEKNGGATSTLMSNGTLPPVPVGTPPRQHKFVKSSSIARLLGNSYHTKKYEKHEPKRPAMDGKFHTYGGRRRAAGPYLDRFKRYAKDDGDAAATASSPGNGESVLAAEDAIATADDDDAVELCRAAELQRMAKSSGLERFSDNSTVAAGEDLGAKAMRTLSRSLGKLWFKRHSVDISIPDPEYKVSYLGNVLTGWAKGEGCVEKQLNTLWRNYTQNNKPDMIMRIKVCASGLKATTRQHGLTEYWANRITHCCAPKNYPRVFCWIYRHEGRKLKHELRCHAVLCSKEKMVQEICNTLKENLERALLEFKREKILKQNARLSLANAAYENPSLPRRKILLSVGGNNYRPPLERSKSAPKLMAIEEAIGEEEGEDAEETNEPEMKSCCQKDSLYPAMTLGRRRCRRGHSIRRTGKARPLCHMLLDDAPHRYPAMSVSGECCHTAALQQTKECGATPNQIGSTISAEQEQRNSYGSDDSDDFEKLLKFNDYDTNASLATELLPYFDMQLHKSTSSSMGDLCELKDEEEPLSLLPTINSDPNALPEGDLIHTNSTHADDEDELVGLRRNGICSDGEEDYLDPEDMYYRQASILNMLQRSSMRKMAQLSMSSDESSIETNASAPLQYRHQLQSSISSNASSTATTNSSLQDGHVANAQSKQLNADSDEGSISSGCETASTVTANQDDISLQYRQLAQQPMLLPQLNGDEHAPITAEEIYQRLETRLQRRQNSDATTFSSSSTITLKMSAGSGSSPTDSPSNASDVTVGSNGVRTRRQKRQTVAQRGQREQQQQQEGADDDTDSECSDESGYVEYQEREKSVRDLVAATEARQSKALLQQQQQAQQQQRSKPQLPPKPAPRRTLSNAASSNNNGSMSTSASTAV